MNAHEASAEEARLGDALLDIARSAGPQTKYEEVKSKGQTMKKKTAKSKLPYVILRCSGAGVHAGELVERGTPSGKTYVLRNARRIWRYNGAQTLSEVAVYGLSDESKIAPAIERQEIRYDNCHEIIHCQPAGRAAIESAKEWRA